ncbi:MAG: IPT/TIG domain-containing protein [Minisyncoccota bacterium]
MKKRIYIGVLAAWFAVGFTGVDSRAFAQATVNGQTMSSSSCRTFAHALYYGSRDRGTDGEVTQLQNVLFAQGYMQVAATGFFGPITLRAVEKFQAAQGVPNTGFVGPLTRAAIARVTCMTNPPPQTSVKIYSVSPLVASVGTAVSITGFGFTDDNTIHFGNGVISHVPITSRIAIACTTDPRCHGGINETLTFTIPSFFDPPCYASGCRMPSWQTVPGAYTVWVENSNGISSAVTVNIISTSQVTPNISAISPASGSVGSMVRLYGAGFHTNDVVLMDGGSVQNVMVSGDGTQVAFTVPESISPYCAPGMMCAMMMRVVTPGDYQVSVKNTVTGSTSNAVSFTITK